MANNTTYIPKFSYPFAQKDKNVYKEKLGVSKEGNYLFTQHGFWHGGIHFEGDMLTDLKANEGIKSIADGELVAYRINENYLNEGRGFYSTGFFLVRHKIEYPTNNKLTFFSLYMHTAKKDAYNIIQNQTNQSNTNYYTVKKGDTLGKIAKEIGVEKEVLQAVAEVESGSRGSFQRENPKHATILYERHYFKNFITKVSTVNNPNNTVTVKGIASLNGEENSSEITVTNTDYRINQKDIKKRVFQEASKYFSDKYPELIGNPGNYNTNSYNKLQEAKRLDESFAIQSCSWGKFQVMGNHHRLLYSTPQELEIAQNQCELQHLQLFKSYLKNSNIIDDMKNKNWREIARKYNGSEYETNNYHTKMENSYKRLKGIR